MSGSNRIALGIAAGLVVALAGALGTARAEVAVVTLPPGSELLAARIDGAGLSVLTRSASGAVELGRFRGGAAAWSVGLDFTPDVLLPASGGGSVVVTRNPTHGSPDRVAVVGPDGRSWEPAGTIRLVDVAALADRIMVHDGGRDLLLVYAGDGRLVAEIASKVKTWQTAALSAAGDAVVVEGGGGDPSPDVRLYALATGTWERQLLPEGQRVERVVALDAERVVSSGDALRLHRFGAKDQEGVHGWSKGLKEYGYDLAGVALERGLILASRGYGDYDVLDLDGNVVWGLALLGGAEDLATLLGIPFTDKAEAQEKTRVLQPEILWDGSIRLVGSFGGDEAYLLRWPGGTAAGAPPSVLRFNRSTTTISPSGTAFLHVAGDRLSYGSIEDYAGFVAGE